MTTRQEMKKGNLHCLPIVLNGKVLKMGHHPTEVCAHSTEQESENMYRHYLVKDAEHFNTKHIRCLLITGPAIKAYLLSLYCQFSRFQRHCANQY